MVLDTGESSIRVQFFSSPEPRNRRYVHVHAQQLNSRSAKNVRSCFCRCLSPREGKWLDFTHFNFLLLASTSPLTIGRCPRPQRRRRMRRRIWEGLGTTATPIPLLGWIVVVSCRYVVMVAAQIWVLAVDARLPTWGAYPESIRMIMPLPEASCG
jgi:hypothetical protein